MTQHKAISTLKSLLPEINETKDPEGVLIKYAHAENLSAAQLEKMAHVFNTLKTINVMDKSASRGQSFEILDPEVMVDKFQASKPARKSAATNRGGEIYLEKVAGTVIVRARADQEGPSWGEFAEDTTPSHQSRKSASVMSAQVGREEERVAFEQAFGIICQERDEALAEFTKKAGGALFNSIQDMRALVPAEYSVAEGHLKKAGVVLDGPPDNRAVAWDRAGAKELFCKYAAAVQTCEAVREMMGEFEKKAVSAADILESVAKARGSGNRDEQEEAAWQEHEYKTQTGSTPQKDWQEADNKQKQQTEGAPYAGVQPGHHGYPEAHSRVVGEMNAEALQHYLNPPKTDKTGKPEKGGGSLEALYGGLGSLLQGAGDTLRSGASLDTAKSTAENYVALADQSGRDRGSKLQRAQASTRAVANLQRLMMTDPIISQADPDKVVQAYNSIRAANPELVGDVNVARSLLREALQYSHLPLNTLQSLISMRETALKTRTPGQTPPAPSPRPQ